MVDWVRENHDIDIEISKAGSPKKYKVFIPNLLHGYIYEYDNEIKQFNYYEALDAAIEEAIKLIEK